MPRGKIISIRDNAFDEEELEGQNIRGFIESSDNSCNCVLPFTENVNFKKDQEVRYETKDQEIQRFNGLIKVAYAIKLDS